MTPLTVLQHLPAPSDDAPVYERKFVAGPELTGFALSWLRHVCLPDGGHPEAVIMSLYYDTPWLGSYFEKLDGDHTKTKYRLRWYLPDEVPDADSCYAFLEIKGKAGDGRNKVRTRVTANRQILHSASLDHPWFMEALHQAGAALDRPLDAGLMPVAVIRYKRHRFICPETLASVSLDSEIAIERYNAGRLTPLAPFEIPALVLEIKDQKRNNPDWLHPMVESGFVRQGFSKYAECISRLTIE